jgi:HAE1 family hydrophobic/amphiphilic exporter-1
MSLANFSVRRPVFALMVTMAILVLGSTALKRLQIDLLPSIELPTITVRTSYDGADPIVMERLVTTIVEEIIATVPGIVEMTSRSYEGNSRIRVSFEWGTNTDTVALEVRATIEDEINELPDEIGSVRVSKFDIDTFPVVIVGISSSLDPVELTEIVDNQIRYRFSRIPGVAQVDPWGGFNREVRIELDPARINAHSISMDDIIESIKTSNIDLPAGKLEQGQHQVTLRTPAEFTSLEQIMNQTHTGCRCPGYIPNTVTHYSGQRRTGLESRHSQATRRQYGRGGKSRSRRSTSRECGVSPDKCSAGYQPG